MYVRKVFHWKFVLILIMTVPALYFPFTFFLMELIDALAQRETLFDALFTIPRVWLISSRPLLFLFYVTLGPVAAFFLSLFVSRKRRQNGLDRVARWLPRVAIAILVLGAGFWVYFFIGG
jgi:hypothetical protein